MRYGFGSKLLQFLLGMSCTVPYLLPSSASARPVDETPYCYLAQQEISYVTEAGHSCLSLVELSRASCQHEGRESEICQQEGRDACRMCAYYQQKLINYLVACSSDKTTRMFFQALTAIDVLGAVAITDPVSLSISQSACVDYATGGDGAVFLGPQF